MNKARKTGLLIAFTCFVLLGSYVLVYALFHGSIDNGRFEVQKVERSSSSHVAMIARRSDDQALGGLQYFVVLGDHVFSSGDLRHAYYHDGLAFRAGSDCLALRWESGETLEISCAAQIISPDSIAVQKHRMGNLTIFYSGIPAIATR